MAHRLRPEPAFVLGSMLPDLRHLTAEALGEFDSAELLAGVRFHHRTDAFFHDAPTFVGLCREALARARDVGVRKGPARAMTHLVVELIIDAALAEEAEARAAYMNALACRMPDIARHPALVEGLDWLLSRGPALHNATPERLTTALGVTLRGRRLLEPTPDELYAAVAAWNGLPERVALELPHLLDDLEPLFGQEEARGAFARSA